MSNSQLPPHDSKKSGKDLLSEGLKCYRKNPASKKDLETAFELVRLASLQKEPEAFKYLGDFYLHGIGVAVDKQKAFRNYEIAAYEHKIPNAMFQISLLYSLGIGTRKDENEAFKYAKQAAELNFPLGINKLGAYYYKGIGVPKDFNKAAENYKKAAQENVAEALFYLGLCYATGRGVVKDIHTALKYFRQAEEKGYPPQRVKEIFDSSTDPEERLAYEVYKLRNKTGKELLAEGDKYSETTPEDEYKAFDFFRAAADLNEPNAHLWLSTYYIKGVGKTKDFKDLKEAMSSLRKGSEFDETKGEAFYRIARIYTTGEGIKQDDQLAFQNYLAAEKWHHQPAINMVGLHYYYGLGMAKPNYAEARLRFERQAEQNNKIALFQLGLLYATGRGVDKNSVKAMEYFNAAEAAGWNEQSDFNINFRRQMDEDEKNAYEIFKRRKSPLGTLLRDEDIIKFRHYAETFQKENSYGRALLFSAIATLDTIGGVKQYQDYLEKIKTHPPFRDRERIVALADFLIQVTQRDSSDLKRIKDKFKVTDPFLILLLAFKEKGIEVSEKLRESIISFYEDQLEVENTELKYQELKKTAEDLIKTNLDANKIPQMPSVTPQSSTIKESKVDGVKESKPPKKELSGRALLEEGIKYFSDNNVNQDYTKAFALFKAAEAKGETGVFVFLGDCYLKGKGTQANDVRAREYYTKASKRGDPLALNSLGSLLYEGLGGNKDYREAFNCFTKGAKKGDSFAYSNLGLMYATGRGVEKNIVMALGYFRQADIHGYSEEMADQYFKSNSRDKEEKVAYEIYNLRNKSGKELMAAANKYLIGEHSVKDEKIAFDLTLAASIANPPEPASFLKLAHMYGEGVGVPQDAKEEARHIKLAVGKNKITDAYPRSAFHLGLMYAMGRGVEENIQTALEYFHQANLTDMEIEKTLPESKRDTQEKVAYEIYQRRKIPLGLLLRKEDMPAFSKLAESYKGNHGRQLIFSALTTAFSPFAVNKSISKGYIAQIKENPPLRNREIIQDFVKFMENILDESQPYHLKQLKEKHQIDEPFVLFNLALEELTKTKNFSPKFFQNVTNKLEETFINIYVDKLKITKLEAKAKYTKLLNSLHDLKTKLDYKPDERRDTVTHYQPLPPGAIPVVVQRASVTSEQSSLASAPSLEELSPDQLFENRIDRLEEKLNREYGLMQRGSNAQSVSLQDFADKSYSEYTPLRTELEQLNLNQARQAVLSQRLDLLKIQIDGLVNQKKTESSPEAVKKAELKKQLEMQQDAIQKSIQQRKLARTSVMPSSPLKTQQFTSNPTLMPPPSIQDFIRKLEILEQTVKELETNRDPKKISELPGQHWTLLQEMNGVEYSKLILHKIFQRTEKLSEGIQALNDPTAMSLKHEQKIFPSKKQTASLSSKERSSDGMVVIKRTPRGKNSST